MLLGSGATVGSCTQAGPQGCWLSSRNSHLSYIFQFIFVYKTIGQLTRADCTDLHCNLSHQWRGEVSTQDHSWGEGPLSPGEEPRAQAGRVGQEPARPGEQSHGRRCPGHTLGRSSSFFPTVHVCPVSGLQAARPTPNPLDFFQPGHQQGDRVPWGGGSERSSRVLMADTREREAHGSPLVTPQDYPVSQLKGFISPKMMTQPRAISEASPSPDTSQPPCPTCLNRKLPRSASLLAVLFLCPPLPVP